MKFNLDQKKLSYGIIALALVLLVVSGGYFLIQLQNSKNKSKALPQALLSEVENNEMINEIAKLVELPTGETPVVATVEDKSKVNNKAFFAKAENKDKVLIYKNNKVAILYRPSNKKIINFATGIMIEEESKTSPETEEVAGATTAPSPTSGSGFATPTPAAVTPTVIPEPTQVISPTGSEQ